MPWLGSYMSYVQLHQVPILHTTTQIINCSVQMPVMKNAPTTTPMAKMEERYNELITKSKFLMGLFHAIFYELDTKKKLNFMSNP